MTEPELQALRRHIDTLDQQILDLLAQRRRTVLAIGALKARQGLPIRDPSREARLLQDRAERGAILGLDHSFVRALFELVLARSRADQQP